MLDQFRRSTVEMKENNENIKIAISVRRNIESRICLKVVDSGIKFEYFFNPFFPNDPFSTPLKTENHKVF